MLGYGATAEAINGYEIEKVDGQISRATLRPYQTMHKETPGRVDLTSLGPGAWDYLTRRLFIRFMQYAILWMSKPDCSRTGGETEHPRHDCNPRITISVYLAVYFFFFHSDTLC